ncbi:hypothetical protein A2524_04420 [Candidatus Wolfebacteria bacterium RIFOXYD12_FULL_48_21]|uniref:CMP/dCMP-type deaminase domain-containing protein n=1 Tax=Candidatus Wolfebacteria bacterium RIFOXYD1_FULL_48_65 TaxID=1802561 RepID=A0A1F8E4L0_9BACT|nr:MAG: hypothetical protein A2610_03500 [Candidatus Wolfebacteria bacterium RIFOXYD1_FULL_48_65]OGM95289.1 MAG: hypothetical protein A2524_04420 [Candidatus Wolfebacteria bacterium RIFOXYD12_FULL_48_21]OGM96858.1 MAG: hypothetical protein A2532_01780 [Candidatus Wolfebacteria bacterium RIFOXYD2_FULL_48_11]
MAQIMIAYMPVLHEGYLKLFRRYKGAVSCLYVFGKIFINENTYIAREIRACDPGDICRMMRGLGLFPEIKMLCREELKSIKENPSLSIIMTDDEFSREFAAKYLPGRPVHMESQFLRWDEKSVNSAVEVKCDGVVSLPHDREMMRIAHEESKRGSCWWRRVGAVVVDPRMNKPVLAAHNRHMPSEHTPYAVGDPRDFVKAGTNPEIAATIHAEPTIVAMAAKKGIALEGMHMYITVFPCGPCASIIAESGISKLFFASGCAYLDGDTILRSRGVEIIQTW